MKAMLNKKAKDELDKLLKGLKKLGVNMQMGWFKLESVPTMHYKPGTSEQETIYILKAHGCLELTFPDELIDIEKDWKGGKK